MILILCIDERREILEIRANWESFYVTAASRGVVYLYEFGHGGVSGFLVRGMSSSLCTFCAVPVSWTRWIRSNGSWSEAG